MGLVFEKSKHKILPLRNGEDLSAVELNRLIHALNDPSINIKIEDAIEAYENAGINGDDME